jgi:hypothetical protein
MLIPKKRTLQGWGTASQHLYIYRANGGILGGKNEDLMKFTVHRRQPTMENTRLDIQKCMCGANMVQQHMVCMHQSGVPSSMVVAGHAIAGVDRGGKSCTGRRESRGSKDCCGPRCACVGQGCLPEQILMYLLRWQTWDRRVPLHRLPRIHRCCRER